MDRRFPEFPFSFLNFPWGSGGEGGKGTLSVIWVQTWGSLSTPHQFQLERRQTQWKVLEYDEKTVRPEVVEDEHKMESDFYFLKQIL